MLAHTPGLRARRSGRSTPSSGRSTGPQLGALPVLWLHGHDDELVPLAETRAEIDALGFTDDEVLTQTGDFIDRVTAR
jgi:predicted esterase